MSRAAEGGGGGGGGAALRREYSTSVDDSHSDCHAVVSYRDSRARTGREAEQSTRYILLKLDTGEAILWRSTHLEPSLCLFGRAGRGPLERALAPGALAFQGVEGGAVQPQRPRVALVALVALATLVPVFVTVFVFVFVFVSVEVMLEPPAGERGSRYDKYDTTHRVVRGSRKCPRSC